MAQPLTRPKKEISIFDPQRGSLNTYRVIRVSHLHQEGDEHPDILLDLGFSTFLDHPALKGKPFKEEDIIEVRPGPEFVKLPKGSKQDLYTYKAYVERVVDGDTLWVRIYLGFNVWIRQKLRFRGINAPELDTQAGPRAKRFVEDQLKNVRSIVITTTKPDKYDRYLSDIWIGEKNLNKLLLERGLARFESA